MIFNWYDNGTVTPYQADLPDHFNQIQKPGEAHDGGDDQSRKAAGRPPRKNREALAAYESNQETSSRSNTPIFAQHIMSAPVYSIREDMRLPAVFQFFQEKNIKHAPVLNAASGLCGLLSEVALLNATSVLCHPERQNLQNQVAGQIMQRPVLTAKPNTPLPIIARILFQEKLGAIPIIDDHEQLGGMLTRNDILKAIMEHPSLQRWI